MNKYASPIVATLLGASMALAGGNVVNTLPPGYSWGLANCGSLSTTSVFACKVCCRDAGITGKIPASDVAGCAKMCDDSVFNRPGVFTGFLVGIWTGIFA